MRLYNHDCDLCPLHNVSNVVCVSGAGNVKTSRILVVGDAPSKQESMMGRTFGDDRGQLLQEVFKKVGIETGCREVQGGPRVYRNHPWVNRRIAPAP